VRRITVVLILLAGCSSAPKATPQDATLIRLGHAGDIAYNLERPEQAAEQYRAALARARMRDDATAIADAGFNLATAELRAGQPQTAMRTAADMRAELARRGIVDPDFDLISATALFRLHNLAAADQTAASLTGGRDPALANAAWFLRGLIADERGDPAGLGRAVASMTPTADPADVAELRSRLTQDRSLALHAADLRRDRLDYRGMARALALAAQFTPDASAAADLYLRAGRSAATQGDAAEARLWLGKARDLTPDTALRTGVEQALHDLPAP
jgi:tetratricopeptide (TPR) repeat protein